MSPLPPPPPAPLTGAEATHEPIARAMLALIGASPRGAGHAAVATIAINAAGNLALVAPEFLPPQQRAAMAAELAAMLRAFASAVEQREGRHD